MYLTCETLEGGGGCMLCDMITQHAPSPPPLKYCLKHRSTIFNAIPMIPKDVTSIYSIKLILVSHYRFSYRYKGLCQNKMHRFGQYEKGGHICAAHITVPFEMSGPVGPLEVNSTPPNSNLGGPI